jgi:hypothetical protein
MSLYTEAALSDSVVYKSFNVRGVLQERLLKALNNNTVIDESYIAEELLKIKRVRISPLADDVISAVQNKEIVLLYVDKSINIPQAFPFIVIKDHGKNKAFVFLNNYAKLVSVKTDTADGVLDVKDFKNLYALMEGAFIALFFSRYPSKILNNSRIREVCLETYKQMFIRILNKEYSISANQELYAKVSYSISRFFLMNMWNMTNMNNIQNIIVSSIGIGSTPYNLAALADEYEDADIQNIEDLIGFLSNISPRLNQLSMPYFTKAILLQYKPEALFSMEVLPYLLFTIQSAMVGSFLINQPVISDILKNIKSANGYYSELVKII